MLRTIFSTRPIVMASVLASSIVSVAAAQGQDPLAGVPLIVVTGEAVVRRAPDVAFLTISIESRAANPRDAQKQNADKAAAVQRALTTAGVARDGMKTVGAWLDQEYD